MPPLSPRFEQAVQYAAILHAGQVRKRTTIPYLSHILQVAGLVLEHGGDEDEAIAGLLHDVVEDCGGRPRQSDVLARFGERVARIVEECTDALEVPKPPWRERKEKYLAHLATASQSACLVSACDKLHNLRSIVSDLAVEPASRRDTVWQRFNGGRDNTIWYYHAVIEAVLAKPIPKRLKHDLEMVLADFKELA
jgi:GTP pyrophosphokinase